MFNGGFMFNPIASSNSFESRNIDSNELQDKNAKRRLLTITAIALVIFGLMTFPKLTLLVTATIIISTVIAKTYSSPNDEHIIVQDQPGEDDDVDDKTVLKDYEKVD